MLCRDKIKIGQTSDAHWNTTLKMIEKLIHHTIKWPPLNKYSTKNIYMKKNWEKLVVSLSIYISPNNGSKLQVEKLTRKYLLEWWRSAVSYSSHSLCGHVHITHLGVCALGLRVWGIATLCSHQLKVEDSENTGGPDIQHMSCSWHGYIHAFFKTVTYFSTTWPCLSTMHLRLL